MELAHTQLPGAVLQIAGQTRREALVLERPNVSAAILSRGILLVGLGYVLVPTAADFSISTQGSNMQEASG